MNSNVFNLLRFFNKKNEIEFLVNEKIIAFNFSPSENKEKNETKHLL
jgi:hypothetical protein